LCLVSLAVLLSVAPVMAAKPDTAPNNDTDNVNNGFPEGDQFTLNIHGKTAGFGGDAEFEGNNVFIPEYGDAVIQYVSDAASDVSALTVLDPLSEAYDGDAATVQLPQSEGGYYVFGRILAKPDHGSVEVPSSIMLYPAGVCQADGVVVVPGPSMARPETYVRFVPGAGKGKGQSVATNISELFSLSGWTFDSSLDTNSDGAIDLADVPVADYDADPLTPDDQDYNGDGVVDEADLVMWFEDNESLITLHRDAWILDIADVVSAEQAVVNDGTKLLQLRFFAVGSIEPPDDGDGDGGVR